MKATELMISDWVYLKYNMKAYQITIDSFACHYNWEDDDGGAFNFNDIIPIPLTEEILKANRFVQRNADNLFILHEHKWINIILAFSSHPDTIIDGYNLNFGTGSICLCYVHELQHALRLCGLDEMADNFKLTMEE